MGRREPVRVVFTTPALFGAEGVFGGGERYSLGLARAVAEALGGATLLAAGPREGRRLDGPLEILVRPPRLRVRGQPHNPIPRGLLPALAAADVVHCFQHRIAMTSLALLRGRLRGVPTFVTDLGGGGFDVSAWMDTGRWAAGFLHLSRFAASIAGRAGHPSDAILYGGCRGAVDRGPGGGEVLFVGRVLSHKGVDTLLEAVEPGWPTVVLGRPMDARYLADLRGLAAGKRVRFLTDADDRGLEEAYRRAAVVIAPSVERDRYGRTTPIPELLGLVAIEAASRGIPVVASRVASLPEVVEDGVTGFLAPPGDAGALRERIGTLLADAGLRASMGEAARRRAVERFAWSRAAEVAIAAYRRARKGRRTGVLS